MKANFETLETHLSETEMALLMAVDVALNAAALAGAPVEQAIGHLGQHEANFERLGQMKAANLMAVLGVLRRNAAGGEVN